MAIKFDITGDNSQFLDAMKRVQDSVRNTSKAMTDAFDNQASVVIDLTNKMNALADEIERAESAGDAKSVDEKRKAYEALSEELKEAKEVYVEMQRNTTGGGGMDAMGNSSQSLRARLKELTMQIAELTLEYRNMSASEQQSAMGKELLQKIESLTNEAGTLRDAMDDVNRSVRGVASDTGNWDALAGGINVATSAIGGLTGAASILGVEEERMQEIQTKLQASLAISNALTVIQNNLQKESALMLKISAIQAKAKAAADAMQAKGTVAATIAQKAFNAVAKANPYVLLAAAIISVVGALALLSRSNKKAAEEEKELAEIQKRRNEELQRSANLIKNVEGKIAEETSQVKRLRDAIDAENIGSQKRNSLINEFNQKFGAYLSKLLTEKSTALDVANAYAEVVKNLRAKLLLEAREQDFKERVATRYNWEAQRLQEFDDAARKVGSPITGAQLKEVVERNASSLGSYSAATLTKAVVSELGYTSQRRSNQQTTALLQYIRQYVSRRVQEDDVSAKWKPFEAEIDAYISAGLNAPISGGGGRSGGGSTGGGSTGGGSNWDANKAAKDRENLFKQWRESLTKTANEISDDNTEAYIDSLKEGMDKAIKELELQEAKGIKDIEEKKEQLIREAQDYDLERWKKTAEGNDEYNFVPRTREEYIQMIENEAPNTFANLDAQADYIRKKYQKEREKIRKEEAEKQAAAILEYEAQYGNYQQRRLALTEKYNKLIAEAETQGEKATLSQQLEQELDATDKEIMESSGLWSDYFGKFESRSNADIRGVMSDIQALIAYMNGEGGEIPEAFANNEKAVEAINAAMTDPKATKLFIDNLNKTWNTFKKMIDEDNPFKQIADGFKNGDWEQMSKGFKAIGDAVGQVQSVMSDLGISEKSGVGKATSIIGNTANYAAQGAQIGGAYGAIAGAALGLVKGMVGVAGTSDPTLIKDIEKLTATNDALIKAVQELSKDMKDASPAQAMEIYRRQVDMLNQNAANTREIMLRSGAAYSNGFLGIGGHGSTNRKINRGMSSAEWAQISSIVGGSVTGASDFWALTQEQMHDVAKYAPVLWAKIKGLADEGLQDVSQYMDAYADGWEAIKEATDQLHEKLTSTTFDKVYDSFASMLSDMDSDAHSFSENFEKYMFDALLNQELDKGFRDRLKDWYEDFATMAEDGLTQSEIERLRGSYMDLSAEGRKIRDEIAAVTGYGSSSEGSATYNAASSFTQEQGDILNGRLTAIQINTASGNALRQQIVNSLAMMNGIVSGNYAALDDMRTLVALSNTHLEDIVSLNKKMLNDFGEKIDKIVVNTNNL